jgi:hypothetical protein
MPLSCTELHCNRKCLTPHCTLHYKVNMLIKRSLAAIEILLIFPATLFMLALFLRNVQPAPYEPAQTARLVVDWFAARPHIGLQLLLIAFPFAAMLIGAAATLRTWRNNQQLRQIASDTVATLRAHASFVLIAIATLVAGGILSIVALHIIAD